MDDEIHHHHRKKNNSALKVGLVVAGVLVLLGVVQAVTAGTVGIGALSVSFDSSTPVPTTASSASSSSSEGGLDGALGAPTTTEDTPTAAVETKVATGAWKQTRGLLTVEVTRVEKAGSRLRLHVTAINASTAKMDLPLGSISAVDDTQRTYDASLSTSKWPVSIAKNSSISGYVELEQRTPATAGALTLTFAGIIGQLAPTGGEVSVPAIQIPK